MPADYHIDADRKVVYSSGTGVFGRAEVLDHMDRLLQDPKFLPDFSQLSDFRHLSRIDLTVEDIKFLAGRAIFSARARRAFVVSNDLMFGLSRMFETYRSFRGETGIRTFREMKDALAWLDLPAEPDRKLFTRLRFEEDEPPSR